MTYIDDYVNRVGNSGGSIAGSLEGNTKNTVINNFTNSPYYQQISIEDNQGTVTNNVDVRVVKTNKSNKRELLFKPDTSFNIGDVTTIDAKSWLLTDFILDSIYPKAIAELCNNTLHIKTGTTETITGYDPMGRPIIETVDTFSDFECIVENKKYYNELDEPINLPENRILVTIQYTDLVQENMDFSMYGKNYKVIDIDYSGTIGDTGIIQILAERIQ